MHDKKDGSKLFLADYEDWLWLVQTGCYWLLKLAVTSSNWFLLIVETGSNKVKPVVTHFAWQERWFKLVLAALWRLAVTSWNWFFTGCWNCLWLVKTGFHSLLKLALTSSNWFLLIVETACDQFKLVKACCWKWLWLVQTGSCSLLKLAVTSSNWFLLMVETGSKTRPNQLLLVVHDKKDGSNWFLLIMKTGSD